MDERIDILTATGKPTGKVTMKSEAHRHGLFHPTVHIWFYTNTGEILLQKRAQTKLIYPALWDVSVAGHIGAGETVISSAIREVKEEIGYHITEHQLQKIGVFKSLQKHSETLIDCEFHHVFLAKLTVDISLLQKQQSEVDDLKLWHISQFEKDIIHPEVSKTIVPHALKYYQTVISEIKKLL